jgi:hypothetical protein
VKPTSRPTRPPVVSNSGAVTLGVPVYDTASHSLLIPFYGQLPTTRLSALTASSGRIYVDIPAMRRNADGMLFFSAPDGSMNSGIVANRPGKSTRISFAPSPGSNVVVTVEAAAVRITVRR